MAITIKKVSTKRELKKFIRFNYRMYKGNPYSVPDLYDDMLNTFNKKKNAAFEFCEADYFLAYRDDKIVGRVAAIINNQANEKWECKNVRHRRSRSIIRTHQNGGRMGKRTRHDSHCRSSRIY